MAEKSEYEPLLGNSEAIARSKRTAFKKRVLLFSGLVLVVVVFVVAITVPLVTSNKKRNKELTASDNIEILVFDQYWNGGATKCVQPPVPYNYDPDQLSGLWYELAKIETPAVSVFQEGCSCATMTIEFPTKSVPQTLMKMECRDARIGGSECGAISTISEQSRKGNWIQTLYGEDINWYIILQTDTFLLTYDCSLSHTKESQYAIRFFSRSRSIKQGSTSSKLDMFIQFYGAILNPQNISAVMIDQTSCDSPLLNEDQRDIYEHYKDYLDRDLLDLEMDFLYE